MRSISILCLVLGLMPAVQALDELRPGDVPVLDDYRCTWLGNSNGRGPRQGGDWVQGQIFGLCVLADGTLYANSVWDEGGREIGIYRDGAVIGKCVDTHDKLAGYAIATDGRHVFAGMKSGFVRRYALDGTLARFPGGARGGASLPVGGDQAGPRGLAASDGELFVSVRGGEGGDAIKVYGLDDLALRRSLPIDDPQQIAVAGDGSLWVVQRGTGESDPGVVVHIDRRGEVLPGRIETVAVPSAIAIDRDGRLLVADGGPDQQIRVFEVGAAPRQVGTVGVQGGIFAGTADQRGTIGPDRLYGVTAMACGADGTLYLNCNGWAWGGTDLRAYLGNGTLRWQLHGLTFVDVVCPDPADPQDVYGTEDRFRLDYDAPAGRGWEHRAYSLDPFRYPHDPRLPGQTSARMLRLGGQRFLATSDMPGTGVTLFRFEGEVAVPCVSFLSAFDRKKPWPAGRPDGVVNLLWRDDDGDGQVAADEFSDLACDVIPNKRCGIDGLFDADGGYWRPLWSERIVYYPMLGIDDAGVPRYPASPSRSWDCPAEFSDMERIEYIPASDTLYVSGYTEAWPQRDKQFIPAGTAIAAYPGWLAGEEGVAGAAAWICRLPYSPGRPYAVAKSMAVAGDYVFVFYAGVEMVVVIDARSGDLVGRMVPTEAIAGTHGDADVPWAITAARLADGRYAVFCEDDRYAKQVVYIWRPAAGR